MIKLGKLENGFVIFDYISKTRVFFQTDNTQNVMITFDAEAHDKENQGGFEATRIVGVPRKEDPRLCELLDELYLLQLSEVKELGGSLLNPIEDAIIDKFPLYRATGGGMELSLPSDDDDLDNCTTFGITKNDKAYILTFSRSPKNYSKNSFVLRNEGSRMPTLFPTYSGMIQDVKSMPMVGFEYENKDFDMYVNDRDQYFRTYFRQYESHERMYIGHILSELDDLETHSNGAPHDSNLLNGIRYIRDFVKELEVTIEGKSALFQGELERVRPNDYKVLQLLKRIDNSDKS
ncbi:MAG: hypothetical protein ACM3O4_01655 [Ignavibacteriales bacterium]